MRRPANPQQRAQAYERSRRERARYTRRMGPIRFGRADTPILSHMRIVPGTYYYRRAVFYDAYGWVTPPYVYGMYPRYGIWDAGFLAFALNHIDEEQYAMMIYNHWIDPEIQQWAEDLNRLAADKPDLHAQIYKMNDRVAQLEQSGTVRDLSYVPLDAQDVALSPDAIEQLAKR